MVKTINKTENGRVFVCSKCNKYHIEYKNLCLNLDRHEFECFTNYFNKIDACYWEEENKNSIFNRKINIPVGHKYLSMLFNKNELNEIKRLFSKQFSKNDSGFIKKFNYTFFDN